MRHWIRGIVLLSFAFAPTLFAQLPSFGTPFPLTNTRYGTAHGTPLLKTNGRDAFLFWTDNHLRVTRLRKGERHVGRPVFDFPTSPDFTRFDVVWTGSHFVVAAEDWRATRIVGRIVDANGHPAGEPF